MVGAAGGSSIAFKAKNRMLKNKKIYQQRKLVLVVLVELWKAMASHVNQKDYVEI